MNLTDTWLSKLDDANYRSLTMFCFSFENKVYFSTWVKYRWSEPCEITKI